MTLLINCTSEAEINTLYSRLSAGGKIGHPLREDFWGSIYGDDELGQAEEIGNNRSRQGSATPAGRILVF
jgi:hypothetical protein